VTHVVEVGPGAVDPVDHDVEAERALMALGGDPPACLRVVDAFRSPARPQQLSRLGLPGRDPLDDAVARARCAALLAEIDERPQVEQTYVASLLGTRVTAAFRASLAAQHADAGTLRLHVRVRAAGRGADPAFTAQVGRGVVLVDVDLSPEWLVTVLAAGAAVVDGLVILDLRRDAHGGWSGLAVAWRKVKGTKFAPEVVPVVLAQTGDGWRCVAIGDEREGRVAAGRTRGFWSVQVSR
jgi:hypothetical protein